jgi:hypothetical protein
MIGMVTDAANVAEAAVAHDCDGDAQDPGSAESQTPAPPPHALYMPACGVLCDVFWWARRD